MDSPGIPLDWLVLVIIVMPACVVVFFGMCAFRNMTPLVFRCRRCARDFTRKPWHVRFAEMLGTTYKTIAEAMASKSEKMPENTGNDDDLKNRRLDCFVINTCLDLTDGVDPYQTIRSPFSEGGEAYPGAKFTKEAHVQVAVRDRTYILGVFRPTLWT